MQLIPCSKLLRLRNCKSTIKHKNKAREELNVKILIHSRQISYSLIERGKEKIRKSRKVKSMIEV